jgi:hypothetical protein
LMCLSKEEKPRVRGRHLFFLPAFFDFFAFFAFLAMVPSSPKVGSMQVEFDKH